MRNDNQCPECEQFQQSEYDQKYLEIYENCWECDRIKWKDGEMTLKKFEKRENHIWDLLLNKGE